MQEEVSIKHYIRALFWRCCSTMYVSSMFTGHLLHWARYSSKPGKMQVETHMVLVCDPAHPERSSVMRSHHVTARSTKLIHAVTCSGTAHRARLAEPRIPSWFPMSVANSETNGIRYAFRLSFIGQDRAFLFQHQFYIEFYLRVLFAVSRSLFNIKTIC